MHKVIYYLWIVIIITYVVEHHCYVVDIRRTDAECFDRVGQYAAVSLVLYAVDKSQPMRPKCLASIVIDSATCICSWSIHPILLYCVDSQSIIHVTNKSSLWIQWCYIILYILSKGNVKCHGWWTKCDSILLIIKECIIELLQIMTHTTSACFTIIIITMWFKTSKVPFCYCTAN